MLGRPPFMATRRRKSILIFNFFGGVLKRGIPSYVENLSVALENEGLSCRQLRCPTALHRLPRPLLNFLFVFAEQVLTPLAGLWFDRVIYPYNSASVAGSFSRKTAMIVHDFISSRGRSKSFTARYIRLTQAIHARGGRDVIYISRSTRRIGENLRKFPKCRTFLFPNAYYCFMRLISEVSSVRGDEVLLCTGWGKNKDLSGVLQLYLDSGLYKLRRICILGLAGHTEIVDDFCRAHPAVAGKIRIMPEVNDRSVVQAYETTAWAWVHSIAEGYGRSIAEARLCGCRVVASNIAPFRKQIDEAAFLYRGLEEFKGAVSRCEALPVTISRRIPTEHELLHAETTRFMNANESD